MTEFPKWLYRLGGEIEWEGRKLAAQIVADAEAEAKAIEDGFRTLETLLKSEAEKLIKRKAKA